MFRKMFLWFCLVFAGVVFSQDRGELLGVVKNFQGEPVSGAMVFIDGQDTGVRSNARGYFLVKDVASEAQVVTVFAEGMGLLSAEFTEGKRLNFRYLDPEKNPENTTEKMSVGYGELDQDESSYAVRKFKAKTAGPAQAASFNIFDLIRQRVPGLYIGRNNQVFVRGNSSLRGGGSPIYVVNGQVVYSIEWLPPNEVETVELLTGPAASIYGTQGAGGVLVFTLKDGS